jgi:hypothetical protein
MPSRIVCDGKALRLGRSWGGGVEARERELEGGGRRGEIAGLVEVGEGGGEASE